MTDWYGFFGYDKIFKSRFVCEKLLLCFKEKERY